MPSHFVYLIKTEDFYKVGISKDISLRVSTIQTSCPHKIDLVHNWEFDCASQSKEVEAHIHGLFEGKRIRGEWFELDDTDVMWLRNQDFSDVVKSEIEQDEWVPPELPDMTIDSVGLVVKGVISSSIYSLDDVAKNIGVTRQTLSKQLGKVTDLNLIFKALDFLGYTASAFFRTSIPKI